MTYVRVETVETSVSAIGLAIVGTVAVAALVTLLLVYGADRRAAASAQAPLALERRAALADWSLITVIALLAVTFIASVSLLGAIDKGVSRTNESLDRLHVVGIVYGCVYIVAGVSFLAWFSRAYLNLPLLGMRDLRYRQGWSIGAWFVPILALFRPKQIANDIWRASDPAPPHEQADGWKTRPVRALLHWWWGVWLAGVFFQNQAFSLYLQAEVPDDLRAAAALYVVSSVILAAAALLALLTVRAVTERQIARSRTAIMAGASAPSAGVPTATPAASGWRAVPPAGPAAPLAPGARAPAPGASSIPPPPPPPPPPPAPTAAVRSQVARAVGGMTATQRRVAGLVSVLALVTVAFLAGVGVGGGEESEPSASPPDSALQPAETLHTGDCIRSLSEVTEVACVDPSAGYVLGIGPEVEDPTLCDPALNEYFVTDPTGGRWCASANYGP